MLAFVQFIFWFIQFALVLFSLCDARSMSNILVAVKVLSAIDTRQNITAATVVLIMLFNLSFPYGLTACITNKRHHFHDNFCKSTVHERDHVESIAPAHYRPHYTVAFSVHNVSLEHQYCPLINCGLRTSPRKLLKKELRCTGGCRRSVTKHLPLTELHYCGKYGKLSKKSSSTGIVSN